MLNFFDYYTVNVVNVKTIPILLKRSANTGNVDFVFLVSLFSLTEMQGEGEIF